MKNIEVNKAPSVNGTHYQGCFDMSYSELLNKLGNHKGSGDKTLAEWDLIGEDEDGNQIVATIYDWKNYGLSLEYITDWHIGGYNKKALDLVKSKLNCELKSY
jgi:hypothetical protein